MSSIFLSNEDVAILTGKKLKSGQVDVLRKMGIPFFINASGRPIVTIASVEGSKRMTEQPDKPWIPAVLQKNGAQTIR